MEYPQDHQATIPAPLLKRENNDFVAHAGLINDGLGILHPREVSLLKKIRGEYRFGEVMIQTADGLPKQIIQTIRRTLLDP